MQIIFEEPCVHCHTKLVQHGLLTPEQVFGLLDGEILRGGQLRISFDVDGSVFPVCADLLVGAGSCLLLAPLNPPQDHRRLPPTGSFTRHPQLVSVLFPRTLRGVVSREEGTS